jgi:hypothetical protein
LHNSVSRRMISVAILALTLLACAGTIGYARVRDLSQAEARDLVVSALDAGARKLPKLAVDSFTDAKAPSPDFYEFAVTWDNVDGSVIVGFFAVNRATGDVWKSAVCSRVESPGLKRLQHAMRKKIGLTHADLRKMGKRAPCEP